MISTRLILLIGDKIYFKVSKDGSQAQYWVLFQWMYLIYTKISANFNLLFLYNIILYEKRR